MSIIKAPCGLNLDADTFEVEGQTVKGKGGIQPATTETLGGVIVGDGLEVEEDGTLNVTGGGGSDDYIIKFWATDEDDEVWVCDKTWEEIQQTLETGNVTVRCFVACNDEHQKGLWREGHVSWLGNPNTITVTVLNDVDYFSGTFPMDITFDNILYSVEGTLYNYGKATLVPPYSIDDDGKVLKVVGGALEWVTA